MDGDKLVKMLIGLQGFVLDLDPAVLRLRVTCISNAAPKRESVHEVSVDGVVRVG